MLILECLYSHSVSCKVRPHPGITTQTLYEPGSQRTRTTRKGALANGASTIQLCHRGDRACWSCTSDFSKKIFVQFFSKLRENVCVCVCERERERNISIFLCWQPIQAQRKALHANKAHLWATFGPQDANFSPLQ